MWFFLIVGMQWVSRKWKILVEEAKESDPTWEMGKLEPSPITTPSVPSYSKSMERLKRSVIMLWAQQSQQAIFIFALRGTCTVCSEMCGAQLRATFGHMAHLVTKLTLGHIFVGAWIWRPMPLAAPTMIWRSMRSVAVMIGRAIPSMVVIGSGQQVRRRLSLQPTKVIFVANEQVVDLFKLQRSFTSMNRHCYLMAFGS